jgi:hypothetical protein
MNNSHTQPSSNIDWKSHAALLEDGGVADYLREKTFAIIGPETPRIMKKFTTTQLRAIHQHLRPDPSSGRIYYSDSAAGVDLVNVVKGLRRELNGGKAIILSLTKRDAWILGTILLWIGYDGDFVDLKRLRTQHGACEYWKKWGYSPLPNI